ncbi:hypothetical protein DTO96_102399 [Ephemeroptericola cinctiostellae]|uniref:Gp5/Type VI secretion system Vgr protein OB-fold domain-containing protein n=1 Tax=Ephemeroptericola cinctiostellae TaxID=2268024 RepID=A0A345DE56_9BURK|nr:phage baseplate assembly protein V [Ephemeroptericola cinctiostellae]AXF86644.1 hypothetical protein DTO96_102399 [Ephemeroptericola cinctiostellae]
MSDDLGRIDALERAVANMIRVGVVKSVEGIHAIVALGDNDSAPMQWAVRRAHNDSDGWSPAVGEQVIVLAPGGVLEDAFIDGALYRDQYPPATVNPDEHVTRYANGARLVHNNSTGDLTFEIKGTFRVVAPTGVDFKSPTFKQSGGADIGQDIAVGGDGRFGGKVTDSDGNNGA